MRKVIHVDFSKKGKELREMTKKLREEKREPLSKNQKIDYMLNKQANAGK
jgi:hypothetical protein